MRGFWNKVGALILSAALIITTGVSIPSAHALLDPPTEITSIEVSGYFPEMMNLAFNDTAYLEKISSVTVNDTIYEKSAINWGDSGKKWEVATVTGAYESYRALKIISNAITYPATITLSAEGHTPLTFTVTKDASSYPYRYSAEIKHSTTPVTYSVQSTPTEHGRIDVPNAEGISAGDTVRIEAIPEEGYEVASIQAQTQGGQNVDITPDENGSYTFIMPADNVEITASFTLKPPAGNKHVELESVELSQDMFRQTWRLSFPENPGYTPTITEVLVNDTPWQKSNFDPNKGGVYSVRDDKLVFSALDFSSSSEIGILKSGDIVTIKADGFEDFSFRFVVDGAGHASLEPNNGDGDPYRLHAKIEGAFEAAITSQKDYDGVSGATSSVSMNKNSAVTAFGALVEKEKSPSESDWVELDNSSPIRLDGAKCSVTIRPDTERGTPETADSGMSGVFIPISSSITLNGTPKDPGRYLISLTITDDQGRSATSNTLPFIVYSGKEKLVDRLTPEHLKKYSNGLYAWDIMEPWAIRDFGSNVAGETESVRVPKDLEVWFGSHQSGTYGYLGYNLPWDEVEAGTIPQTLYIPAGCHLTLVNMEILSSVRIVVEGGGKLTLSDSVVQGVIDVKRGGTFSMNYNAHTNTFEVGASLGGYLHMEDGSTLENAAIYSHINYLANGDRADRTSSQAVVTMNGNVTVKGSVFIEGDESGHSGDEAHAERGQTALRAQNATVTLSDGATLAVFGGGAKVLLFDEGGRAIELDNATISGNGKLIALGGPVLWGNGGNAVTGNGTISTSEAYLQGASARSTRNAQVGKAIEGAIALTSTRIHQADGTLLAGVENDPLEELYWKVGIDAMPPLAAYHIDENADDTTKPELSEPKPDTPTDSSDPIDSKPVDTKPIDTKPVDTKPTDSSSVDSTSPDAKPTQPSKPSTSNDVPQPTESTDTPDQTEPTHSTHTDNQASASTSHATTPTSTKSDATNPSQAQKSPSIPDTGDGTHLAVSILTILALLGLVTSGGLVCAMKYQRKE